MCFPVTFRAFALPLFSLALCTCVEGQARSPRPAEVPKLRIDGVARGFAQITDLQFFPGRDDRLLVLQKGGALYDVRLKDDDGHWRETSRKKLIDLKVQARSELGLLGLAFHPKFADNARVFINYNPKAGKTRTRVQAFTLDKDKLVPGQVILEVDQPYSNHDAGQLAFGPDGMLYIGLGDGGARADPKGHGQNRGTLLGAMLRVDVDNKDPGKNYAIPKDNPFLADKRARPELWAIGIRNPWRYTFTLGGDMVIADVGQDLYEEVHVVKAGDNLGWNTMEGFHCFPPKSTCDSTRFTAPVFEYGRDLGQSITGGEIWTSDRIPALKGTYLVGDFVSGRLWGLKLKGRERASSTILGKWSVLISTFGKNASGEVFLADFGAGVIYGLEREGS